MPPILSLVPQSVNIPPDDLADEPLPRRLPRGLLSGVAQLPEHLDEFFHGHGVCLHYRDALAARSLQRNLHGKGIDKGYGYSYSKSMPTLTIYITKALDAKLREHTKIPKSKVAARALWRQVKRAEKNGEAREEATA